MNLTRSQQALFWRAYTPAWQAFCRDHHVAENDRKSSDEWRHAILFQECGCTSLAQVRRGAEFDRLLKRLAVEAGDYARAAHMEAAEAGRTRCRCIDCARQICEITGRADLLDADDQWAYVCGFTAQAYRGRAWLDITERELDRVFMMLDTHRRRLLKRAGWLGRRADPSQPLSFQMYRTYLRQGERVILDNPTAPVAREEVPA